LVACGAQVAVVAGRDIVHIPAAVCRFATVVGALVAVIAVHQRIDQAGAALTVVTLGALISVIAVGLVRVMLT